MPLLAAEGFILPKITALEAQRKMAKQGQGLSIWPTNSRGKEWAEKPSVKHLSHQLWRSKLPWGSMWAQCGERGKQQEKSNLKPQSQPNLDILPGTTEGLMEPFSPGCGFRGPDSRSSPPSAALLWFLRPLTAPQAAAVAHPGLVFRPASVTDS